MKLKKKSFDCGNRLRQLRKKYNLSQEQLALKADVTPSYISQLERGLKNPTVLMIETLCEAMGCSLSEFFCGIDTDISSSDADSFMFQIDLFFKNKSEDEKQNYLQMLAHLEAFYNNR